MPDLPTFNRRERFDRAARHRNARETFVGRCEHDGAVGQPGPTGQPVNVLGDGRRIAAVERNALQIAVRNEAHRHAVGREERMRSSLGASNRHGLDRVHGALV